MQHMVICEVKCRRKSSETAYPLFPYTAASHAYYIKHKKTSTKQMTQLYIAHNMENITWNKKF
jgi:hypothetical protein